MDASYKIQRGIHVHLIQFFMCPEFWVHINIKMPVLRFFMRSELFFAAVIPTSAPCFLKVVVERIF